MINIETSRVAKSRVVTFIAAFVFASSVYGDGKVMPPRDYKGSLEEMAQEAIIIFHAGSVGKNATEDLILKIRVAGEAQNFAWIIPFPNEPKVSKEDDRLFKELFDYVQAKKKRPKSEFQSKDALSVGNGADAVKVLSRKIVGDFDIAVVQENKAGALNQWLEKEGFQTLENAEDVLDFYRNKQYVYACVKVSAEALESEKEIESSPLRFRFDTGGRDGIFFPMKLTGLQEANFDVNLYVFFSAWLNDNLNKFGYMHRGFKRVFRDYDSPQCESNAGKSYSLPSQDPYLKSYAHKFPTVTKLLQKLYPGQKYYLTNISARNLDPQDVREWSDDLWMFPFYTDRSMVPFDVRGNGPAATAWPNELGVNNRDARSIADNGSMSRNLVLPIVIVFSLIVIVLGLVFVHRKSAKRIAGSS